MEVKQAKVLLMDNTNTNLIEGLKKGDRVRVEIIGTRGSSEEIWVVVSRRGARRPPKSPRTSRAYR